MRKDKQLELIRTRKLAVKEEPEKKQGFGRRGILILLVVTTLISLGFYLKRLWSGEIKLPKIGGVERITFEK